MTPAASESQGTKQYAPLDAHVESTSSLSPAGVADREGIVGTVRATVGPSHPGDYGAGSDVLTRSNPLATFRDLMREESSGPRLRAADLVAELNVINGQIHRIMAQVEQAVARLVPSGH